VLNDENMATGLFEVDLWSWDDIVDRAADFPEVAGDLVPTLLVVAQFS